MLQIGWIDYSKEHRDRVMSVLDMLTSPGALDELGISVVRDAFADRLFPGLSTLLTRAKYFLIVPWIMRDLERENLPTAQFINRLKQEEIGMIKVLIDNGEKQDVIGQRSRERLKRKPSEIYWNGLRTFGIFRDPHLSLGNYQAIAHRVHYANQVRREHLNRDDQEARDDKDAFAGDMVRPFWDAPPSPPDWKTRMTFALSGDEARFLRDKIITSPQSKDSLLAHILSHCARAACDCVSFNALATLEMPERLQREFELARDFAHLISGAHLRYNIAFFSSINQPEKAERIRQEWDRWVLEMDVFDFSRWDTWAMLRHLRIDANRHAVLFVVKWIETYARQRHSVPDDEFDAFVTKREIQIKGRERAKIGNWFEYDGDWIGIDYLQYRWPNARKIIMDIATGLDENDAATHA